MVRYLHTTRTSDARADAIARTRTEVMQLYETHFIRLVNASVQQLSGMTSLCGRGIVRVQAESGKTTLYAHQVALATSIHPTPLPVPGAELVCTSDDMFGWDTLPVPLIIAGDGVIAVEMASTLAHFGVQVTVLTHDACVLSEFNATVAEAATLSLAGCGVDLILNADVVHTEHGVMNGGGVAVYVGTEGSDVPRMLHAQHMLSAIGHTSNITGLGLEAAGVTLDACGRITIDRHFRTYTRGVHTVGDICGDNPLQLVPVAVMQGRYMAGRLFGKGTKLPGMNTVPVAVFCGPAIAGVGLTETNAHTHWPGFGKHGPDTDKRALADHIGIVVHRFVPLEQRFVGSGMESLIKLVCNTRNGRVLDTHIADNATPEVIQTMAVAVHVGVRLKHLQSTVGLHPTVTEELLGM